MFFVYQRYERTRENDRSIRHHELEQRRRTRGIIWTHARFLEIVSALEIISVFGVDINFQKRAMLNDGIPLIIYEERIHRGKAGSVKRRELS